MYNKAAEKGTISSIPDIEGLCVWKKGHIGVYVGNGQIIEAYGAKYGVIETPLKGGAAWTYWLKCPYIDYVVNVSNDNEKIDDKIVEVLDSMEIKDVQHVCTVLGIKDHEGRSLVEDNANGKRTESAKQALKEIITDVMK